MKKEQFRITNRTSEDNEINIVKQSILAKANNLFAYNLVHLIKSNKIEPKYNEKTSKVFEFTFQEGEELFDSKMSSLDTTKKRVRYVQELIKNQEWQEIKDDDCEIIFMPISQSKFNYKEKKLTLVISNQTFEFYEKMMSLKYNYVYLTPKEINTIIFNVSKNQRDGIVGIYQLVKDKLHRAKFTNGKVLITYEDFEIIGLNKKNEREKAKFKRLLGSFEKVMLEQSPSLGIKYEGKRTIRNKGIEFAVSFKKTYLTKEEIKNIYIKLDVLKNNGVGVKFASVSDDKVSYDWCKPKDKPYSKEVALVFGKDYIVLDFDKLGDEQQEFYNEWKKKGLVQKTKHGVHVLLKNDLGISVASTQMYWNGKRVDFRGLGKSYIKLYNQWEGKLNNFSDYFDLNKFVDKNNNVKTFKIEKKTIKRTLAQQIAIAEKEIEKAKHISGTIVLAPFDGFVEFSNKEDLANWFKEVLLWNVSGYIHEVDFEKAQALYKGELKKKEVEEQKVEIENIPPMGELENHPPYEYYENQEQQKELSQEEKNMNELEECLDDDNIFDEDLF